MDHSGPVPPSPRGLRRTGSAASLLVEPPPISGGRAGSRAPIGCRGALLFSAVARAVTPHPGPPGGAVGGAGPARGAVLPPGGRIAIERGQGTLWGTEGHRGDRGTPQVQWDTEGTEGYRGDRGTLGGTEGHRRGIFGGQERGWTDGHRLSRTEGWMAE